MWVKPSINGRLLGKSPGLRCGGQELNFTGTVSYRRGLGLPPNELEGGYLPNSDNGLRCFLFLRVVKFILQSSFTAEYK